MHASKSLEQKLRAVLWLNIKGCYGHINNYCKRAFKEWYYTLPWHVLSQLKLVCKPS